MFFSYPRVSSRTLRRMPRLPRLRHKGPVMQARLGNNSNNNNLYCALDTKSVKTLKGNNCEKRQ